MEMSIGFDVSKETIDVVYYDGFRAEHTQIPNSADGFTKVLSKISKYSEAETIITMEATGIYHQSAADFFFENGFNVSVVNPLIIRRYSEMKMLRAKTDKVDAKLIATYGMKETAYLYRKHSENSLKIKAFLKIIDNLLQTKNQNSNRLEALCHQSVRMPVAEKVYLEMNAIISGQIKEIEKEIVILEKSEFSEEINRLLSIPGIGKRTSAAMIAYFEKMENFSSAKQLVSFIGINPSLKTSGTSVRGHGTISKKGNAYLRKLLYLAALSASKHNKACSDLYKRLLEKGKSKKTALIAVANKLARQMFAILKYGREYDSNFCVAR